METITGAKGGSQKQHTPVEQPDSAQSMARCRMLLALGKVSLLVVWMRPAFSWTVRRWETPTVR
ncbi:hypothetical protein ACJ5XV_001276 [Enterobacter hormaechei]